MPFFGYFSRPCRMLLSSAPKFDRRVTRICRRGYRRLCSTAFWLLPFNFRISGVGINRRVFTLEIPEFAGRFVCFIRVTAPAKKISKKTIYIFRDRC